MSDLATLFVCLVGLAILLETLGLYWNATKYVVPVHASERYAPRVRVRMLSFVEPRLYQFLHLRSRGINWWLYTLPPFITWWSLGRSWQTAVLAGAWVAHLVITWVAWYQWNTIWQVARSLPVEAKQRFVILQAAHRARQRLLLS